jgi:hypothetical protein
MRGKAKSITGTWAFRIALFGIFALVWNVQTALIVVIATAIVDEIDQLKRGTR